MTGKQERIDRSDSTGQARAAAGSDRATAGKVQRVKCTLNVYPLPNPNPSIDNHFLGRYGYRVLLKTGAFDIPTGFMARFVVTSTEGSTVNGAVMGNVKLKYGGTPENWNEDWRFWEDLEITAFSVGGAQPDTVALSTFIALADSQLDVRLRSKDRP